MGIYAKGFLLGLQPNTNSILTVSDSLNSYDVITGQLKKSSKWINTNTVFDGICVPAHLTDARKSGAIMANPSTGLLDNGFIVSSVQNLSELNQMIKKTILNYTNSTITAVDPITATVKWRFKAGGSNNIYNIQLSDNALFTAQDEGYIHAVDLSTGTPLWKSAERAGVSTNLVLANNMLYGLTSSKGQGVINTLTSFDASDGSVKATHNSPVGGANRFMIIDDKGNVFASPFLY